MRINVTPGQVTSLLESLGRVTAGKMVLANKLTEAEAKAIAGLFQPWKIGEAVEIGTLRQYDGDLYKCVQAHITQADWTPDIVPALWTIKSAPGIIPVWSQPAGSHDSYPLGARMQWPEGGAVWESLVADNVWEPGAVGSETLWEEVALRETEQQK
jgi:hypothetical protein